MNDIIRKKFEKNINEQEKHIKRLKSAFNTLESKYSFPITSESIEKIISDDKDVVLLDQIVYRFSKLQDNFGKIFRLYFLLKGENVENLTIIDVINLAEKVGLNITKEKWFELRELRNILTHEYEDEYDEIAKVINKIYSELEFLEELLNQLKMGGK